MYSKMLSTLWVGLALMSGSVLANQDAAVAKIVSVKGSVLVENSAGQRQVAKPGMVLSEGSSVIVLEKGKADLEYVSSQCNSSYQENTLLTVAEAMQCPTGQQIAVGQASRATGGKFGSMASNTGGGSAGGKFGGMMAGGVTGLIVPAAIVLGAGIAINNVNNGGGSSSTPASR